MSQWKWVKLGDIIRFGNGKERPRTHGSFPVFGGNGILGYCDRSNYENETIIIGRVGAYCGSVYYEQRPIWVSDNALAAKSKGDAYPKFLYYLLKYLNLNDYAEGSGHPLVTQSLLNSIQTRIPQNIEEQKSIASILSSLDDKIDLLHRQNATLEAMAETLFRQWFVEEAKEEWEEYQISDIADHIKINVKASANPTTLYYHYSLPAFDEGQVPSKEFGSTILSNKFEVLPRTVLVSKLNPRFPRIWPIGDYLADNSICSTEFQVIRPKQPDMHTFLIFLLKSDSAKEELIMAASGTSGSHQRVRPEDILNIRFAVPSIERAIEYSRCIEPMVKKMMANRTQVQTLSSIRDTLLPKLMSGRIGLDMVKKQNT